MIHAYFTLFVGLLISGVAEYYSIVGLTSIFPSSFWPIVIMGASLGIGKITAAVWLKLNWSRATLAYKLYLVPAVVFLMFLTSIGCFGYLSKAHSDQGLVSGDIMAKIAVYDEKIKIAKENIEINRKALKQMDEAVDQVMSRSSDERGADKAIAIRKSQAKERARLLQEIEIEQKNITKLNETRAPIAGEIRKIENETGPLKYIAAIIYGDNTNANLLESAVRILIIMIVIVFDPLALVLILAAQQSIRWAREEQQQQKLVDDDKAAMSIRPPEDIPGLVTRPWTAEEMAALNDTASINKSDSIVNPESSHSVQQPTTTVTTNTKSWANTWDTKYTVQPSNIKLQQNKPSEPVIAETVEKIRYTDDMDYVQYQGKLTSIIALKTMRPDLVVSQKDLHKPVINFGPVFPKEAVRGEYYVKIDVAPHAVYQFLDNQWMFVNKNVSDVYLQNKIYVQYLIKKLESGEYDIEWLTAREREEISLQLEQQ